MRTKTYLEHANLAVTSIDESLQFFNIALPSFKVRHEGIHNGRRWVHLGTDDTYLALNELSNDQLGEKDYDRTGLNHLGFVVENVEEVAQKLLAEGYKRSYPKTVQKYRVRDYFLDKAGNEYEFVQYLSDDPTEKNDYSE